MDRGKLRGRLADNAELKDVLHDLLTSQQFGVLCTQSHGQPHGSVMCFVVADDLSRIWFATPRNTRKYEDMRANDRVAFVVENTRNRSSDVFEAVATTSTGQVRDLEGPAREAALALYLARYPHLEEFATSPACALVELEVASYQVVRQFQHAVKVDVG